MTCAIASVAGPSLSASQPNAAHERDDSTGLGEETR